MSARGALRRLVLAATVLLSSSDAFAQQATLQITQGPYNSGVPIELHVVAQQFDEDPQPEVSSAPPPGTTLQLVQARPQVSSSVSIVNGHISQSREVTFAYIYQLTTPTPGRYTLGPFTVTQGSKTATTGNITINVVDVPQGSGQRLRVVLPNHPIFLGQRVPVTVEWWTEAGVAERLFNQRLTVPLFLDTANFQFLDEQREPSRITISVDTPAGNTDIPVDVKTIQEGAKSWVIRSFSRTLVPVAAGRFDLGAPALFCEEATAFQRDIFGSRVPSQSRRVRISGDAVTLDVQAVPAVGRPASFAGAIGQGFTIDVAADRTVLQTGDPVKLSFTIHGDGSLDAASLPPLAEAGLSPKQFHLPDGDTAGLTDDKGKHFDVNVRVIDPAVREIPPIEYSWFNPGTAKFESTHSQPIALSVRAATVVGSGDVVSAVPAETKAEAAKPAAVAKAAVASKAPTFTLTGADLSIETDVAKLRASSSSLIGSPSFACGAYLAGLLALAAGFLARQRRRIDPAKAALQKEVRALRTRVAKDRSAKAVADALRRMASLRGDVKTRPAGVDDALRGLDEMAYAPSGETAAIPDELRRHALSAADAIVEEVRA